MDCLSNLCMLRAGICFVTVSGLLCLYYLGAWPLTYMICSAPKKKSYIWLLWEYLFLYPSFSQWCPLLRCICICFWRDYSFTSHRPTQSCFLLGMGDSLCFFTLEPFNAGHPRTEAWLSMKTCISVVCSCFWYFSYVFPSLFLSVSDSQTTQLSPCFLRCATIFVSFSHQIALHFTSFSVDFSEMKL